MKVYLEIPWNLLKKNKIEDFEKYLQNILLKSTSYNDTKNEDFYHGLILGMTLFFR